MVTKSRLEAFSDAVIAIVMTIMVLELVPPHDPTWSELKKEMPTFSAYLLSFVYLGIYWNNHHHMFSVVDRINGKILWANLHLLFWLSLFPFMTAWIGESEFNALPVAAYGCVSLLAAIAYYILQLCVIAEHGRESRFALALGRDLKGKASPLLYISGIAFAPVNRWISFGLYVFVALMWLIPDRRFESLHADVRDR